MLLPVGWLKDYIDTGLSLSDLCDRLTLAGLEVEGTEGDGEAAVIDVNVTPNRPDTLSVVGIARELGAILQRPVRGPETAPHDQGPAPDATVEIRDPDLCPRYAARVVRGVRVGPSPAWLVSRLEAVGIRPINNVVDVTNYVLMELGHPMHAFDLATLGDRKIVVRRAEPGERFTTLDGVERRLDGEMLTIRDGAGPVAVAGVMGGQDSEVSETTREVLLEAAYFFPASVRRTSRILGLRSESSYRFERGTDIEGLIPALDRASALVAELAGGVVAKGRIDVYPVPYQSPVVTLETGKVRRLLGMPVSREDMTGILERLGFRVAPGVAGTLAVTPPTWRRDVEGDADLIEEVARLHGYDRVPSRLPSGASRTPAAETSNLATEARIRQALRGSGFSEAVNYSFMNPAHLDALGLPAKDPRRAVVELVNPLRSEEAVLRSTLLPSLLECLGRNRRRGRDEVRLFEISRTFINKGGAVPEEPRMLAAIYAPSSSKNLYGGPPSGFFDLKGAMERLIEDLRIAALSVRADSEQPFLDNACAAQIFLSDECVGCIGALSVDTRRRFDIEAEAFYMEMDLGVLVRHMPGRVRFRRWPKHPSVDRDMALVVPAETPSDAVLRAAEDFGNELIRSIRLFDVYTGRGVPGGRKSLAYAVRYQADDRTLTVEDVDEVHRALLGHLEASLGAVLRA